MARAWLNGAPVQLNANTNDTECNWQTVCVFVESALDAKQRLPSRVKRPNPSYFTIEECDAILSEDHEKPKEVPDTFLEYARRIDGAASANLLFSAENIQMADTFSSWSVNPRLTDTSVLSKKSQSTLNTNNPSDYQFRFVADIDLHEHFLRRQLEVDMACPLHSRNNWDRSSQLVAWVKFQLTQPHKEVLLDILHQHHIEPNPFKAHCLDTPMLPLIFMPSRTWCDPKKKKTGFTACVSSCIRPQMLYWTMFNDIVKNYRKHQHRRSADKRGKEVHVHLDSVKCWKCGRRNKVRSAKEELHTAETCVYTTYADGAPIIAHGPQHESVIPV